MYVVEHHSLEQLTRLAKRQIKVGRWVRLQVIIRAKRGKTGAQLAAVMNVGKKVPGKKRRRECFRSGLSPSIPVR